MAQQDNKLENPLTRHREGRVWRVIITPRGSASLSGANSIGRELLNEPVKMIANYSLTRP